MCSDHMCSAGSEQGCNAAGKSGALLLPPPPPPVAGRLPAAVQPRRAAAAGKHRRCLGQQPQLSRPRAAPAAPPAAPAPARPGCCPGSLQGSGQPEVRVKSSWQGRVPPRRRCRPASCRPPARRTRLARRRDGGRWRPGCSAARPSPSPTPCTTAQRASAPTWPVDAAGEGGGQAVAQRGHAVQAAHPVRHRLRRGGEEGRGAQGGARGAACSGLPTRSATACAGRGGEEGRKRSRGGSGQHGRPGRAPSLTAPGRGSRARRFPGRGCWPCAGLQASRQAAGARVASTGAQAGPASPLHAAAPAAAHLP